MILHSFLLKCADFLTCYILALSSSCCESMNLAEIFFAYNSDKYFIFSAFSRMVFNFCPHDVFYLLLFTFIFILESLLHHSFQYKIAENQLVRLIAVFVLIIILLMSQKKEVTLTRIYTHSYYGNIVISSTITYEKNTYNVTSIGNDAFAHCPNLTSITIPKSVIINFIFCQT